MDRTERFYTIDRLLRARRRVSLRQLMEELEVSRATVRRDLEYMRDRMAAPIVWDRTQRGYRYDVDEDPDGRYALPGLWFNASEVYALLTMDHLLSRLQPGLLEPHIEPLRTRVRRLLDSGDHPGQEVERRIRVLHMASRQADTRIFASIAYGAIKTAHISEYLATPSASYLGITSDDIVAYDLPSDDLSSKDIEALKAELTDPRFADTWWQDQINMMLDLGKKAEQQSLAKYGLDFVTDTYLPEKLKEQGLA